MSVFTDLLERRVFLKADVHRSDDILSAISHLIMVPLAIAGTILLIIRTHNYPRALGASILYGVAMCFTFTASAIYHGLSPSIGKKLFRVLDHCSIYILIAGTYTPFSISMPPQIGRLLLIIVWSLCLLGIVLKILLWGRWKFLHMLIYLGMGWLVVFFWKPLSTSMHPRLLYWMFAGGLFYTGGVYFFIDKRVPRAHFIWHLCVIGGAICMYLGVFFFAVS